jgi:hypothetical protein
MQHMLRTRVRILFGLSLLGIAPLLFAEEKLHQDQASTTDRMNFAPGGTIRINPSYGDLRVEGWDLPEVEITEVKSMPFDYKPEQPDEASRHLENVHIVTERKSSTEIVISTTLPTRSGLFSLFLPHKTTDSVAIEYKIHVPRNSNLVIHHGMGSVLVGDVTGNIEATCGRGDIVLMLPETGAYSFDAKSKLGAVVSDFGGTPRLRRYRLGERYAAERSPSSEIRLRVGFGGITIKAVLPEAYGAGSVK